MCGRNQHRDAGRFTVNQRWNTWSPCCGSRVPVGSPRARPRARWRRARDRTTRCRPGQFGDGGLMRSERGRESRTFGGALDGSDRLRRGIICGSMTFSSAVIWQQPVATGRRRPIRCGGGYCGSFGVGQCESARRHTDLRPVGTLQESRDMQQRRLPETEGATSATECKPHARVWRR